MTRPSDLIASLDRLALTAAELGLDGDWIVFGGAAMALAGYDGPVPDIDVLASPQTARRLLEALGGREVERTPGAPFRSSLLARIDATPVPIEVMVDLQVQDGDGWAPVAYRTRVLRRAGEAELPTPDIEEQIAMARRFGRPKDLARAEVLAQLAAQGAA